VSPRRVAQERGQYSPRRSPARHFPAHRDIWEVTAADTHDLLPLLRGIGVASGARLARGNGIVTFAAVNRSRNYNVL
jgi:hypothetical protein